ncbi:glycoside hydrolase family 3 C-terminal domain-containing protein [Lachnospiraceae bacterium 45-W7]
MMSKHRKGLLKTGISLALSLSLLLGSAVTGMDAFTVNAATPDKEESAREKKNAQLSRKAATQGMVLLENNGNVLPISTTTDKNIALFGPGAERPIKGGTGSGDVNQRYVVSVTKGLENAGFTITSKTFLERWEAAYQKGLEDFGDANIMSGSYVHPDELITENELAEAAKDAKTAVYVLSRRSGEGADRSKGAGDYLLSETEEKNLTAIGAKFDKVIVVLNVGGVIDTKFFSEIKGLDAMLLMSNAGMESGNALADVLTGAVTPSGKLTDTWAKDYSDYPSAETFAGNDGNTKQEDYTDGIYVGYRYFDSFNKTPAYEFGYGKSYTTFDVTTTSVTADAKQVKVVANVKNTGNCSGKEVVQVYFSAPDGAIEKPYQELAGYAKTDELKPGESQELTITYATTEMSSYNESTSAYVMEKGDYIIRVGNSSRNTKAAAVISLDKDKITEQLSTQLGSDKKITEISRKGQTAYQSPTEAADLAAAVKLSLSADAITTQNNASKLDNETVTAYVQEGSDYKTSELLDGYEEKIETVAKKESTLEDVVNKKATMQEFVAQLSQEELAKLCNGIGMASFFGSVEPIVGAQSDTVDGAAGETTSDLEKYKVPAIVLADGPAGIRINQEYTSYPTEQDAVSQTNGTKMYQFCTAWPIGTLLAQSWDVDLIEEVGKAIGEELVEMGVTLLLAPGMNIHRNPLCGRNFEYYSEDPLLTGTIAAAETFGVQSNPGVGVTLKHFAVNNQESDRNSENNTVTERTLREIYLKGFEIAVKSAQPMAIMTSYNKINSEWAMNSYDLITDIAREEWGFQGLVMTDWMCAGDDTVAMHAGNDLIMPGNGTSAILGGLNPVPSFDENGQVQLVDKSMWTMTYKGTDWSAYTPDPNGTATLKAKVTGKDITVTTDDGKECILVDGQKIILNQTASWTGLQTTYVTTNDASIEEDGIVYKVNLNKRKVMALGDVQKSAMNILNIITQSYQMAKQMTGDGTKAVKYSSQFDDLVTYQSAVKGAVKAPDVPKPDVPTPDVPKPDVPTPPVTTVSIAGAKVDAVKDQAYTGKEIKPGVKVSLNGSVLKNGTDYTVSYKNNKNIGTATITITGKGTYTGTKSASFKIVPKKTASLKAVSKTKKQVKLTWKRDKQATGYEIYVKKPGSKKFTLAKRITKNKTVSFTAKKLKSKKQYQYKVRAYKKIGKTIYPGAYSAVKKVKVK